MIALIDADSIVYMIAWHNKDVTDIAGVSQVKTACDEMITSILSASRATKYLGSFSSPVNFRHRLYKFAPYKGTRKEKDSWMVRWEPIIKAHLCEKWGFFIPLDIEADDVMSGVWHLLQPNDQIVICSPDKDLTQIPGLHYDYKKLGEIRSMSDFQSGHMLCTQMLTGDTTDNIKGIPGLGDVKVKALLSSASTTDELMHRVKEQYYKHFGEYYGNIIYLENVIALQLLGPTHPLWNEYEGFIKGLVAMHMRDVPLSEGNSVFSSEL